jgi:multidrug efflux pump subunit AcrA (membrane-fusion protein)
MSRFNRYFKQSQHWFGLTALVLGLTLIGGCSRDSASEEGHESYGETADEAAPTNRIAIPASVRQNLGITFVNVERRPVRGTMRIAGEFELRPEARREYHVMVPGRVQLLVHQYARVEQGQPLFHLDSPQWQQMQNQLVDALNAMRRSHADVDVAQAAVNEVQASIAFLETRIANLAEAEVRQVALEAELAEKRNALPRLEAELAAAHTEFDTVHARYDVMLNTAASLSGIPREQLDPHSEGHGHMEGHTPPWRSINRLTIHAEAPGVVDRLPVTNQGWVETGDLVLDTVDPTMLRFHADALQTDINLFADGQPAQIVPPQGGSFDLQQTAAGHIAVGFEAHPGQRTVPIYLIPDEPPRWAKAGVTAYLEVFVAGDEDPVLAIPEATVVRDGLERIFFRRDPKDPDQVIRVVADLGTSDNRWIEVKSGVRAGDEIVLGGVYPLMLASSTTGEIQEGGHFHADGTFHESDDH